MRLQVLFNLNLRKLAFISYKHHSKIYQNPQIVDLNSRVGMDDIENNLYIGNLI